MEVRDIATLFLGGTWRALNAGELHVYVVHGCRGKTIIFRCFPPSLGRPGVGVMGGRASLASPSEGRRGTCGGMVTK